MSTLGPYDGEHGSGTHLVPEKEIELAMQIRKLMARGEPPVRIRAKLNVSEDIYAKVLPHVTAHARDFYPLWEGYVARCEQAMLELSDMADSAEADDLVLKKDCITARHKIAHGLADLAIKLGLLKLTAERNNYEAQHAAYARGIVEDLLSKQVADNKTLPKLKAKANGAGG